MRFGSPPRPIRFHSNGAMCFPKHRVLGAVSEPNGLLVRKRVIAQAAGAGINALKRTVVGAILLIGITAAAFAPVLGHQFIESWDDTRAILANPDYNPPTFRKLAHYWVPPPKETFYVPVTYTLWGLLAMVSRSSAPAGVPFNPRFFYAANLVSHALTAGLVFMILLRLLSRADRGRSEKEFDWPLLAAWLGAAFFAMHPVQVEGVAIASSVYTPLSGMFGFLAVWQFLVFSERDGRRARIHYALAFLAFLLAVLTKPTAVAVPLIIGVIELVLQKRTPRRVGLALAPWLGLSLLIIALNEHASPGATVFVPDPPFRLLVPLDALGFYTGKILLPFHLVFDYGRSPRWLLGHPVAWPTCLIAPAIFILAWRLRARAPWLLASLGVLVAGALPSIGIVPFDYQHYSTVADRYLYIAMLGPAIAAAYLVQRFKRPAATIIIGFVGILAALSVIQLGYWRDDWRLMAYTLQTNPQSLAAGNGFRSLLSSGPSTGGFLAPTRCTLDQQSLLRVGDLLMARRFWQLAASAYRHALARGGPNAEIYDRLGDALLSNLEPRSASQAFAEALKLAPGDQHAARGATRAAAMLQPPATAAAPKAEPPVKDLSTRAGSG